MTVLGFALLCTAFMNAQRPKGIRITNVQCTAFRGPVESTWGGWWGGFVLGGP